MGETYKDGYIYRNNRSSFFFVDIATMPHRPLGSPWGIHPPVSSGSDRSWLGGVMGWGGLYLLPCSFRPAQVAAMAYLSEYSRSSSDSYAAPDPAPPSPTGADYSNRHPPHHYYVPRILERRANPRLNLFMSREYMRVFVKRLLGLISPPQARLVRLALLEGGWRPPIVDLVIRMLVWQPG